MKLVSLILALGVCQSAGLRAVQSVSGSPLTRVVDLLKGMASRVEDEMKAEEDLYETYVCWAKTVVSQKTQSNTKAASRKESLETYISDLDAGRVELTSERTDLEKEVAALTSDIETATALRDQEKEDYEAAKAEMDAAIEALKEAVTVMKEGMGKDAALLSMKSGFKSRVAEGENLARAVAVGRQVLSKGDALFLQRILTGDVPVVDHKKLNRKATFKMTYKARSEKILDTLKQMLFQFENTESAATDKEEKAAELFTKLMTTKESQKDQAQDALSDMSKEGAARGLTKTEALDEIEALGDQITADEGFIAQTEADLKEKKGEWTERKGVRMAEVAAIGKAVSILHSDDSRDLFKKSLSSQGYSFFQVSAGSDAHSASVVLAQVARATKDTRLSKLASSLINVAPSHFAEVISAIDKMIAVLDAEEADDLKKKEKCEQDRADDTKEALDHSREMDEIDDSISRLESEIKELEDEKKEKETEIEESTAAYKEAKVNREKENEAYLVAKDEDLAAAELVDKAKDVLTKFYAEAAFLQRRHEQKGKQPEVAAEMVAGEAPPPPPSTWDAGYSGKQEENTGVITMLETIYDDIQKDITKCETEEKESAKAFTTYESEYDTDMTNLKSQISDIEGDISDKDDSIVDLDGDHNSLNQQLKAVMDKLKDEQPGCDFVTVNYESRLKNRQIEVDGLKKAKTILSGGSFDF